MRKMKFEKAIIAMLLTLIMVFQMASPIVAFAAVSDEDTSTKYTESLGDNASTEYAGRVWTDKSVFTTDATFDTYGGGSVTVKLDGNAQEDFLISYSALATSQSISGQSQAPVDVVLILDISGSMSNGDSNMDNGKSRIYNTVQAANASIASLMSLNENTRVAVVVFSSNAQVLLPLGRYEKVGSYDYLSVNRQTASNNYAQLTVRAKTGTQNIEKTVSVEGGTNIQMGLYEGMQLLAEEETVTATINGVEVQRVPSVILLSDGSPTYSSNSGSWWAPSDNYNDGPGSSAYAGNGMKAILVGAYMKDAIDRNYKVAGTSFATKVYTVGMGITNLPTNEKNLAYMTLDPGTYWNDSQTVNSMKTTLKEYWSKYTANNNTGTLNINVGQMVQSGNRWVYTDKNYALRHPTTGYDVDSTSGYDYVDGYYGADNASAVNSVFEQIVSEISISAPQVPTELKGGDPLNDGLITYTDPIGKYLEVKDVKSIIYAGTEFTQKSVSTDNGKVTYTFSGEVHSPVYGDQNIRDIQITVEKNADGDEILTVKIPASVIPLRVNEVKLNADGSVKSHTNNGAFPTRVIYSVGLRDGIKKVSDDGHEYVDITQISDAYRLANTNADGTINFYSNVFSNTNTVHGYSAGDATVEFEPSHSNAFYYILEDMPIYKDREFQQKVPAGEGLSKTSVYYYKDVYYHGTTVEEAAIARTGEQLLLTEITTGDDGYLYRAAGSPRLNRILRFEGTKTDNVTGTAQDFYAPSFVYADGSSDPFDGKFVIYLGNNGLLSLPSGGNLQISKAVAAAAGLTAPGKTFTFTIDMDAQKVNGGEYTYVIRDAEQKQVSTGTVSAVNNTISLTDGQVATIYSLPPMTTYTITEAAVDGFASESTGASGTIHAGHTQQAAFTNTYSASPVTSDPLEGKKIFKGRAWENGDSFTFFLHPYNDCPVPEGYDVDNGITVTAPDVAGGEEASFSFGSIEFTAPGIYRYTVTEKEPENDGYLPGLTYSHALFRIVIRVEDNGEGKLVITSSDIQRLYDDHANQLFAYNSDNEIVMNSGEEGQDSISFTNTYKANSVTRVPVAMKAYTDPSGTKPLASGMFEFQLKAVGYTVDNGEPQTDISGVPMPAGSQNGVIVTTNEGHEITFPAVEFTQDMIPAGAEYITFHYEMSEVIPQNKVPGMTYDETVFEIDVKVEIDHTDDDLLVSALYPDEYVAIFENSFELKPVTADINGSKVLNGRDMLEGESFGFTLVGANAATNNAVRDGVVTVPESEATVSGGKDGKAEKFSFEDIEFTKPGTYTFLVSETAGSAPAVIYDDSLISVTFEIADKDGDAQLDVVSTTYSNGKSSADFVNTYSYGYSDPPVNLTGTKNLTGKSLLDGEFFFNVKEYHNGKLVNERLVGHTGDETGTDGVYTGEMVFLEDKIYAQPGTYTYIITEQIPADAYKVQGTKYDESECRFTVVVEDDAAGNLFIASEKLEKAKQDGWEDAQSIVFNNSYVPESTTAELPLIRKIITGDRNKDLESNEFQFALTLASGTDSSGIKLPAKTVVGNAANGDIAFAPITFTKAGEYTVQIREVIPSADKKVPGISYSTDTITAIFTVTDNRNGVLSAVLTQFDADTFINDYTVQPNSAVISGRKELVGGGLNPDAFRFSIYETDDTYDITGLTPLNTLGNAADGSFTFHKDNTAQLYYEKPGTHYYVLVEDTSAPVEGIRYDTTAYRFQVEVSDKGNGELNVDVNCINGDASSIVFRNVPHDKIAKKEVALESAPTVSVDGKTVNPGDVLRYTITYHNYTNAPVDVTVRDTIPGNVTVVGIENGGTQSGSTVTWELQDVAPDTTATVSFTVEVNKTTAAVENKAVVIEGANTYETNAVSNPVEEDILVKDVFRNSAPTVSIDGKTVNHGQILVYEITYTNADDAAAEVTITDQLPQYTTFVGAEDGGSFADGVVTWKLNLAAGESKTVSFKVKVNGTSGTVSNQATALEGNNRISSNVVNNPIGEDTVTKTVALAAAPSVSIDGKTVENGDVLVYKITYTNSDDASGEVTITDQLPQYTTFVSADNNGSFADGVVTWKLTLAAGETRTVTLMVKVNADAGTITNQATALEGENRITTNTVTNSIEKDTVVKDVFAQNAPTVSIDGKKVERGDVLVYKITYTNSDDAAAEVTVTDQLPQYTTFVSAEDGGTFKAGIVTWKLTLAAGESKTVSFKVKVNADEGVVTNQASALEGENEISTNIVTNPIVKDTVSKEVYAESAPAVSIDGKTVNHGQTLVYEITYTNVDDAPGEVTVTDQLPRYTTFVSADNDGSFADGVVTWKLTLAAGESKTVSVKVKVDAAEGTISNQATALEGENEIKTNIVTGTVVDDTVTKDVFSEKTPDISIDGQKVSVGDVLVYKITYTNVNDAPGEVTITDLIPSYTTYVENSADFGGVLSGNALVWNLILAAGESKTVSFKVQVAEPDAFIDNQATALESGNEIKTNIVTNHTYEEVGDKDVVLPGKPEVSIDGNLVAVGEELQYNISYTNITDAPVDVIITDVIPAHTAYVNGSASNGGVYTDGKITWQVPALQPRQSVTVSFRVTVQEAGKVIENQAEIFDGTNKVTNRVTNSVPEKTVDKPIAVNGDVLTYMISYVNRTGTAAKLVITDKLSAALQYVEGTAGDGVYADGVITWSFENVPAGGQVQVSFQAVVKADASAPAVSNKATVIENDVHFAETNETVTKVKQPVLTILKEQNLAKGEPTTKRLSVKPGNVVTYTITVTNTGEGDAHGLTIADKIPDGLTYVANSANLGGKVENRIISWTLDALAPGESVKFTFQVKVPRVNQDTLWVNIAGVSCENHPNGDEPVWSNEVELERLIPTTPETGDEFNALLFVGLMILSSFGVAAMLICKKREEEKEASAE